MPLRPRHDNWVDEVVKEDMKIKQALFARVEPLLKKDAIVSSNTSGLSIKGMTEGAHDGHTGAVTAAARLPTVASAARIAASIPSHSRCSVHVSDRLVLFAAVAMSDGPEAGLALIDAILVRGDLADYHLAHAARGDLCRRLGRVYDAIES